MNSSSKEPICLPSLKILGDYWKLRIIDVLSENEGLRFNEIARQIEGINTATLTKRLKDMCSDNIINRTEHSRADVLYELTDLGKEALPLLHAVNHFSDAMSKYPASKK
ncbi:MAG: helix-turn-helix domain-containing protein [Candidatus Saccharimonadales bacterium]|nr:hypothetical protein [Patescibacteria group bacterium]